MPVIATPNFPAGQQPTPQPQPLPAAQPQPSPQPSAAPAKRYVVNVLTGFATTFRENLARVALAQAAVSPHLFPPEASSPDKAVRTAWVEEFQNHMISKIFAKRVGTLNETTALALGMSRGTWFLDKASFIAEPKTTREFFKYGHRQTSSKMQVRPTGPVSVKELYDSMFEGGEPQYADSLSAPVVAPLPRGC